MPLELDAVRKACGLPEGIFRLWVIFTAIILSIGLGLFVTNLITNLSASKEIEARCRAIFPPNPQSSDAVQAAMRKVGVTPILEICLDIGYERKLGDGAPTEVRREMIQKRNNARDGYQTGFVLLFVPVLVLVALRITFWVLAGFRKTDRNL